MTATRHGLKQATELIGSWILLAMEHKVADGPWQGARPVTGRLLYSGTGFVSVVISVHASDGSAIDRPGPDEFIGYSGRFEVDGDTVSHQIDVSFHTGWVGTTQKRTVQLSGDELVLVTAPFSSKSGLRQSRLRWRRETPKAY